MILGFILIYCVFISENERHHSMTRSYLCDLKNFFNQNSIVQVEFLWQMVLQMLDLLSSKRSTETNPVDGKDGTINKFANDTEVAFVSISDMKDGRNIDLKDDDDDDDIDDIRKGFK